MTANSAACTGFHASNVGVEGHRIFGILGYMEVRKAACLLADTGSS